MMHRLFAFLAVLCACGCLLAAERPPKTFAIDFSTDLGQVKPRVGFLGGLRDDTPDDLLKPLHISLWRIGHQFQGRIKDGLPAAIDRVQSLGAKYKLVMSDLIRSRTTDWGTYEGEVKRVMAQVGARRSTIIWEPVNEPDLSHKPIETYYELYAHAFKALRAADPQAEICGPGFAFPTYEKYKAFLDYCKQNRLECNDLAWHYTGWEPDKPMQGKWGLERMRQFIADYPEQKIREIHCDEWGAGPDKPGRLHPGRAIVWFYYLESVYQVDRACRANWGRQDDYLGGIVNQKHEPYPVYHAYRWYGQTAGQERVRVEGNGAMMACLASRSDRRWDILLGSIDRPTQTVILDLKNVGEGNLNVAAQVLSGTNIEAAMPEEKIFRANNWSMQRQGRNARIILDQVRELDAYRFMITSK